VVAQPAHLGPRVAVVVRMAPEIMESYEQTKL
jgi:hypothetical protein